MRTLFLSDSIGELFGADSDETLGRLIDTKRNVMD